MAYSRSPVRNQIGRENEPTAEDLLSGSIERISMLIRALTVNYLVMVLESVKRYCGDHIWPLRSGHARVNDAQRMHIKYARLFLWEQMVLHIVVTTSDDVTLITAMRGNIEHPSEDGRSFIRQKHVFIRRPITRVCCFSRADLATTITATKRNKQIGNTEQRCAS